jgi:signal transduction histidine kinase
MVGKFKATGGSIGPRRPPAGATLLPFLVEFNFSKPKENMSSQRPWQPWFVRLLCLLYWAGWLCAPHGVLAQDRVLEKAYWSDTTGTASFEQAREARYTPYTGVLSEGFKAYPQWVRLKIDGAPPGGPDQWVLRIRPVFLDEISLHDPLQMAQGSATRRTGDRTPITGSEFDSLHHTFVVPTQAEPRYVWLRLSTTSTQLMHVEALSPRDMLREEHGLWLAYSALLAVLFSCWLWVFLAWLKDRDPVNGIFVVRQMVLLLYTASFLGYHRMLMADGVTPLSQDFFYNILVLLTTALSVFFEYRFLREYVMPAWGKWLLRSLLVISFVATVLLFMGVTQTALNINMVLNGVALTCLFWIACRVQLPTSGSDQAVTYQLPKLAVVSYYLVVIFVLALSILPSLGVLQGNVVSIYVVLLYGLISGLTMTGLLIVRSRNLERIRIEVNNSLFLSRQQLAIETRRRQDQSQLLNMLMHELKTPLAVIDLALKDREPSDKAQSYVGRAIANMKSILERCVQTDRLIDRPFEVRKQRFDLAAQLQQWLHDNKSAEGRIALHSLPVAPVDQDLQCTQIIASNLLENALKYGDPQQPVRVSLQAQTHADGRSGLCLRVANASGAAGRPDAQQVFAKYYRSAAAQRQSGTGLGLYLSHNLATQMGADLRYLPTDTHIQFELWLPT